MGVLVGRDALVWTQVAGSEKAGSDLCKAGSGCYEKTRDSLGPCELRVYVSGCFTTSSLIRGVFFSIKQYVFPGPCVPVSGVVERS